jgi:hypothetical protein
MRAKSSEAAPNPPLVLPFIMSASEVSAVAAISDPSPAIASASAPASVAVTLAF